MTAIFWFRRDLRLTDNPGLTQACASGMRLLPLYIYAPQEEKPWQPGAASCWWLHHSLIALDRTLRLHGNRLQILQGETLINLKSICQITGATRIYWNRLNDPALRTRDAELVTALQSIGITCIQHEATLLFEPWWILTQEQRPYRVFSPFWRACMRELFTVQTLPPPPKISQSPDFNSGLTPEDLNLLPKIPWDTGFYQTWKVGEEAAQQRANDFLTTKISQYEIQRDFPNILGTSLLSPHLHFGEISPRWLLAQVNFHYGDPTAAPSAAFVRELGWREFAYYLLYHFPDTTEKPFDQRFVNFPWRTENINIWQTAWQQGRTGIPIIDAGMRELWQTGWMHNRVRMLVASFLTKNLRLPWQIGARWFWDTLVDADLACNTLGWQWSAGCGVDAVPYFRIFNPVLQSQKFDKSGKYIRRWCPELIKLPDKFLNQPWEAPPGVLAMTGIKLGENYPVPLINLKSSRHEALTAWTKITGRAPPRI